MFHTIIQTSLHPQKQSIERLGRILIKALKKWWKQTVKYFAKVIASSDKDECIQFRKQAEELSREKILDIINDSEACQISSVTTEDEGRILESKDGGYTLILDALDGMNNFKLGIPNFSVSAGILHEGVILLGIVYNPVLDTLYYAEKGKWSYKDWLPIHVNNEEDITKSAVAYIHEYRRIPQQTRHSVFGELIECGLKRFIMDWSPANDFCLLAEGKFEWILCNQESLYDFCAGKIIAEEAGAITTYLDPNNKKDTNDVFIISNTSPNINKTLTTVLRNHAG